MDFPFYSVGCLAVKDCLKLASYIKRNAILFYNIVLCQTAVPCLVTRRRKKLIDIAVLLISVLRFVSPKTTLCVCVCVCVCVVIRIVNHLR